MLAIIYRAWLQPEKEALYLQLWKKISHYFVTERGALGSCLHQSEDGYWVIYSRWPIKPPGKPHGQAKTLRHRSNYPMISKPTSSPLKSALMKKEHFHVS